jgi:nicotinamidase-related amidase
MTPYTLVVIDMQNLFVHGRYLDLAPERQYRLIGNVVKAVNDAHAAQMPVVMVQAYHHEQFSGRGDLIDELKDRTPFFPIWKHTNQSAAEQILALIRKEELPSRLRVCGIWTGCCVKDIVCNLLRMQQGLEIEVLLEGCCAHWGGQVQRALTWMAELGAVIVAR